MARQPRNRRPTADSSFNCACIGGTLNSRSRIQAFLRGSKVARDLGNSDPHTFDEHFFNGLLSSVDCLPQTQLRHGRHWNRGRVPELREAIEQNQRIGQRVTCKAHLPPEAQNHGRQCQIGPRKSGKIALSLNPLGSPIQQPKIGSITAIRDTGRAGVVQQSHFHP
jgi:hypothetical protein